MNSPNSSRRSVVLSTFFRSSIAALLLPSAGAVAQTTYTWTGTGVGQLWSDGLNWAGGSAPNGSSGSTDAVVLGLTGASAPVVDSLNPWYLQTLNLTAGSGNVTLTGNDLNFSSATILSTIVVNASVNGIFNHSISNNLTLMNWNIIRSGLQSGGNLTLSGNITAGTGSSTIVFRGIGNASSASGVIGGSGSSKVIVQKFDAGTWLFSNAANRISAFVAGGGKTVVGANNALGDGVVLSLGNTNALGNISVDLGGFSQKVGGLTGVAGDNVSNRQIVTNSSATLGVLTYERTSAAGSQTFAGQFTGNLAFDKRGSNTLALTDDGIHANSGENTFTGPTTISEGTLLLAGDAILSQTSSISISAGATFDVSQTTSGFTLGAAQTVAGAGRVLNTGRTLTADGHLAPGGTLSIDGGVLALGSTTDFTFTLGAVGDLLLLTNGATLSLGAGTLGFDDFTFLAGTGFGTGTYVLISGAASVGGSLDIANLSGAMGGFTGTLAIASSDLVVNVVPEPGATALILLGSLLVIVARRRHRAA